MPITYFQNLGQTRLQGVGRCITTPDYDKYVTRYKAEKEELENRLVDYTNNDKSFILTASHLLELAQNARSIFQSSQPAQKNKILKALLANCQINEKRLQLNLLKPFSVLIDSTLSQNWLRGLDSNYDRVVYIIIISGIELMDLFN